MLSVLLVRICVHCTWLTKRPCSSSSPNSTATNASIREYDVITEVPNDLPAAIKPSAPKFPSNPGTGLAVVFDPATKWTYEYYTGPDHKLMRTMKNPKDMK
jgi:hypothetical protein